MKTTTETILTVRDLKVDFTTPDGTVHAVKGIDLDVKQGETLAVVGESGSGKSQTMMGIMGLLASNGEISGSAKYRGRELLGLPVGELNKIRGAKITMIFQEPMTSLDPLYRIGAQIAEPIIHHRGGSKKEARARVLELLRLVGIPEPERRIDSYPHELSGGQRQRVMIAMALINNPRLLLADEPTTALDATVQIQILLLLRELQRDLGLSVIFVTHDIGAAVEVADRIAVMYAGRIVEEGTARELIRAPRHPYTIALLRSRAHGAMAKGARLDTIAGAPPDLSALPPGCAFAARCALATDACRAAQPPVVEFAPGHRARCLRTDETAALAPLAA